MSDFVFLYPQWLLTLLPLAILMAWGAYRPNRKNLIAPHLAKALGVERANRSPHTFLFIGLSLALAILSLAGPSFEKETTPTFTNASARVLIMDMSRSMHATDNKPDRLTQAKYKAKDILSRWKDGYTGLVAYAADGYTVSPLTTDTATIENLLPSLSPDIMPYPGANAAKGVAQAIKLMKHSQESRGTFVLLTDDIDNQEKSDIESLLRGSHWNLIILGLGSASGAPIPMADGSLLKDKNGLTVIAKSNFKNMESLAKSVNGTFVAITVSNQDVQTVVRQSQSFMSSGKKQHQVINNRANNGYWIIPLLLIPGLILFRKGVLFSLILLFLIDSPMEKAMASPWLNHDQQAKKEFDAKQYSQAADQFSNNAWKGAAYYRAGKYQQAVDSFSSIKNPTLDDQYNLGNALAKSGHLKKAIEEYQKVLTKKPDHQDAKHNLEVVKKALQQQQQQQQHNDSKKSSKSAKQKNSSGQQKDQSNQSQSQSQSQKNNKQQQSQKKPEQQKNNDETRNSKNKNTKDKSLSQSPQKTQGKKQELPNKPAQAIKEDKNKAADPELRKLQQVENARDPSRLLRAQLLLQAQQKAPPENQGKEW